jgi:hypothetical protein
MKYPSNLYPEYFISQRCYIDFIAVVYRLGIMSSSEENQLFWWASGQMTWNEYT